MKGVRGVIHVGANRGQERDLYRRRGVSVAWIEAIPEVFEDLAVNLRDLPSQRAFRYLVTDQDGGRYEFHVASNGEASSSILDLKMHRAIWPHVHFVKTLSLTSVTLPTLLTRERLDPADYDALVLDTQGSELRVLEGARSLLPGLRFIKTEAADFEAYAGGCVASELSAYLAEHGFVEVSRKKFAEHPGGGSYHDIVYQQQHRIARATRHPVSALADHLGAWRDFRRNPDRKTPFNGQHGRLELVKRIVAAAAPDAIVETGTSWGATTGWFARELGVPIHSFEALRRRYLYARKRLSSQPRARLCNQDSRVGLCSLASRAWRPERPLFYLDAHGGADLPLWTELEIITKRWARFVVVVDDFEVPGDEGYRWDDYGPGNQLTLSNVPASVLERTTVWWPALPSCQESGKRRGCVVLASHGPMSEAIARVGEVRRDGARSAV